MSFKFKPAVREKIGLLISLSGGTGSGKTLSALKLATGMSGGKKFAVIDTENGRALHYADDFNFDHGTLSAPFRPGSYLEAIQSAQNYSVIVIDSTSHIWDGDGGILDWHEEELNRMAGNDCKKREACKMAAWVNPKVAHKQFVQKVLQLNCHIIFCFRAEPKVEMIKENGKTVIKEKVSLVGYHGWIPLCEKRFPFEMTTSFMFMADRPGFPLPIKLQEQHKSIFNLNQPITEKSGELIAAWADGGKHSDDTGANKIDAEKLEKYADLCETAKSLNIYFVPSDEIKKADELKKHGNELYNKIKSAESKMG